jgi:hypothetical protein
VHSFSLLPLLLIVSVNIIFYEVGIVLLFLQTNSTLHAKSLAAAAAAHHLRGRRTLRSLVLCC